MKKFDVFVMSIINPDGNDLSREKKVYTLD